MRSRYRLLMLQVFIDDSGRGNGPAFVLCGYLAAPAVWESFSREWQAELATEPSIRYFKMREAAHGVGQFFGHRRELIEHRVSTLVGIMERHELKGVTVALDSAAFTGIVTPFANKLTLPRKAVKMFANPYFHCFYQLIAALLYAHKHIGVMEPIDFIFDEQGKEGRAIRDYWSVLQAMIPEDDVRAMLSTEPVFRDDKVFLPLQAADLGAWQIRNLLSAVADSQEERVNMNPIMARLAAIPHLELILNRKSLQSMMDQYAAMELGALASLL